jgi:hypothetical protein
MKNYINTLLLLFFFYTAIINAQVGPMTNNPNNDAVLDLNTANGTNTKGLLLPKVTLQDLSSSLPMASHTEGLQIYNTKTAGTGALQATPGMYYSDGEKWVNFSSGWETSGNGATIVTENYMGTNTATDFSIRTNNTERMRINSNGQVLVGTSSVPTGGTNSRFIINNGTTKGALQIQDRAQNNNYVLVSDDNGCGQWKERALTYIIKPNIQYYATLSPTQNTPTSWDSRAKALLVLPPGKWYVDVKMSLSPDHITAANEGWWVRSTFSDSDTVLGISPDISSSSKYISGALGPNTLFGMLSGTVVINNTSNSNKTYYYIAGYVSAINATGTITVGQFGNSSSIIARSIN